MGDKKIIFDTDFLSTIFLIDKFELVSSLYPDHDFVIPDTVKKELFDNTYRNSPIIQSNCQKKIDEGIIKIHDPITINDDDFLTVWSKLRTTGLRGGPSVDKGEADAITLQQRYRCVVASNNLKDINFYSRTLKFELITFSSILFRAYKIDLITKKEASSTFKLLKDNDYKIGNYNSFEDFLAFMEE